MASALDQTTGRDGSRPYNPKRVTLREWRTVALFTLIVIVITTAPYVVAWATQGDQWRFGGMLFGVEDGNSYLGKMRLGARGIWNFYLFYTSESHSGAPLFYLPYITTGWIVGRLIPANDPRLAPALMVAFHVLRAVCNAILIPMMYAFIAAFTRSVKTRRLALMLATFGGGIGWLLALMGNSGLLGSLPIDVYVPEGFSFLVLFGLPHIALGRAALLGMLLALMQATSLPLSLGRGGWGVRLILIAAVCGWVVALAVPFYLALAYVILGAWGLAAWITSGRFPLRLFVRAVFVGVMTLPLFAYFAGQFVTNEAFSVWSSQNDLPSPHVLHYVFGYVLLAVPAVIALWRVWRMKPHRPIPKASPLNPLSEKSREASPLNPLSEKSREASPLNPLSENRRGDLQTARLSPPLRAERGSGGEAKFALLLGWLLIVPILVYLPINVQRRMSEGVIVPLAILAAVGLRLMARRVRFGRAIRYALIGAAVMTCVFLLFGGFLAASNAGRPIFRPANEIAAFDWLNANAEPDAVILTAPETGNVIPAYTSLRTYMGHGPETLFWQEKTATLTHFYQDELSNHERNSLLDGGIISTFFGHLYPSPIRYIYYGERERLIAPQPPAWTEGLTLIYDVDDVQIYEVPD